MEDQIFKVRLGRASCFGNVGVQLLNRRRPLRPGQAEQQIGIVAHIVQHHPAHARGVGAELAAAIGVNRAVLQVDADLAGPVARAVALDRENADGVDIGPRNKGLLAGGAEDGVGELHAPDSGPVAHLGVVQGEAALVAFVAEAGANMAVAILEELDLVVDVIGDPRRDAHAFDEAAVEAVFALEIVAALFHIEADEFNLFPVAMLVPVFILVVVPVLVLFVFVVLVFMFFLAMGMGMNAEREAVVLFDLVYGNTEKAVFANEGQAETAAARLAIGVADEAEGVFHFLFVLVVAVLVMVMVMVVMVVVVMLFLEALVEQLLKGLHGALVDGVTADLHIVVAAQVRIEVKSHIAHRAIDVDQGFVLGTHGIVHLLDDEAGFFRQTLWNPVVDDIDDAADGAAAIQQG